MIHKIYCLGKCGTLLAYQDIDHRFKSAQKQQGYCDDCKPKPSMFANGMKTALGNLPPKGSVSQSVFREISQSIKE